LNNSTINNRTKQKELTFFILKKQQLIIAHNLRINENEKDIYTIFFSDENGKKKKYISLFFSIK
jgi:hypothetical protein